MTGRTEKPRTLTLSPQERGEGTETAAMRQEELMVR